MAVGDPPVARDSHDVRGDGGIEQRAIHIEDAESRMRQGSRRKQRFPHRDRQSAHPLHNETAQIGRRRQRHA